MAKRNRKNMLRKQKDKHRVVCVMKARQEGRQYDALVRAKGETTMQRLRRLRKETAHIFKRMVRGDDYITVDGITVYKYDIHMVHFLAATPRDRWGTTARVWFKEYGL